MTFQNKEISQNKEPRSSPLHGKKKKLKLEKNKITTRNIDNSLLSSLNEMENGKKKKKNMKVRLCKYK